MLSYLKNNSETSYSVLQNFPFNSDYFAQLLGSETVSTQGAKFFRRDKLSLNFPTP